MGSSPLTRWPASVNADTLTCSAKHALRLSPNLTTADPLCATLVLLQALNIEPAQELRRRSKFGLMIDAERQAKRAAV